MKLIAIFNVWDAWELLEGSIRQIREHVDCVIAISQRTSNQGEYDESGRNCCFTLERMGLIDGVFHFNKSHEMYKNISAMNAETRKRQTGISYAQLNNFTHFIHLDCDEYYDSKEFAQAKKYIDYESIDGSYCSIQTYYKNPEWAFNNLDSYFVPFIHRVKPNTTTGIHNPYPVLADPTRRIGPCQNVLPINPGMCKMHHFSYIRTDIEKKLRNSTARNNFNIPAIMKEYREAGPGSIIKHYSNPPMRLMEVENRFGITIRGDEQEGQENVEHTTGKTH